MSQPRRTTARITVAAVALVALVAAIVSYAHIQHLAQDAGEAWRSHLLPLSVDGLLVTAAMSMLLARRHDQRPTWLARVSLGLGIAASLAANIASAEPSLAGRLVAAWPPLALALATELLVQQGRHHAPHADHHATAGTEETASPPADEHAPEASAAPSGVTDAPETSATAPGRPRASSAARTGGSEARARARAVFEQARAEGRAEALTGAELARAARVHPGTARKWLAAWRAEPQPDPTTAATSTPEEDVRSPEHAEEEVAA